jgi:hypothetical protein
MYSRAFVLLCGFAAILRAQGPATFKAVLERYDVTSYSFCDSGDRQDKPLAQQPPGPVSHQRTCTGSSTNATFTIDVSPLVGSARIEGTGYHFDNPIQVNATIVAQMSYPKTRGTFVNVAVPIADSVDFRSTPKGTCVENVVKNTAFEGSATVSASNNCARNAFQSTRITEGGFNKLRIATYAAASPVAAAGQTAQSPQVFFEVNAIYRLEPEEATITSITPNVAFNDPKRGYAGIDSPEPLGVVIRGERLPSGGSISLGPGIQIKTVLNTSTEIWASLGSFGNLPEGPRDVIFNDSSGKQVAVGKDLFYISSLMATIEVNQGVPMDCTARRPCIADHDTAIRIKLECNAAAPGPTCSAGKGATVGVLHVLKDGEPLGKPASPIRSRRPMAVLPSGQPASPQAKAARQNAGDDSIDFYFRDLTGEQLAEGSHTFLFDVDGRNPGKYPANTAPPEPRVALASKSEALFARSNVASNHDTGWRLIWFPSGRARIAVEVDPRDQPLSPQNDLTEFFRFVRAVYPASKDMIEWVLTPTTRAFTGATDADEENFRNLLKQDLAAMQSQNQNSEGHNILGDPKAYTHLMYFSSRMLSSGLGDCAMNPTKGWLCQAKAITVQLRGQNTAGTVAHELGHHFDLGDTYTNVPEQNLKLNNITPDCAAFGDGCPVETEHLNTQNGSTSVVLPQSDPNFRTFGKRDFMGNSDLKDRWVDLRSWNHLYPLFNYPASAEQKNRDDRFSSWQGRSAEGDVDRITVLAYLRQNGTAELLPALRSRGPVRPADPAPGEAPVSEHKIELRDRAGSVLVSRECEPLFQTAHRTQPSAQVLVSEVLPYPPGTSRIVLLKNGVELTSRDVSPNAPTVQLISPSPGSLLENTVGISWAASDLDGDSLTYSVFYSTGDGQPWVVLATNIAATSFDWDTRQAPGGSKARLMVVANDGVNSGSAIADSLTLAVKSPSVRIKSPEDGAMFAAGDRIVFEGAALDFQDGPLGAESLVFRSDRDGVIGTGAYVEPDRLSSGRHRITLEATNSGGMKATVTVGITAGPSATAPRIDSVMPTRAAAGAAVTISGANFSAVAAGNTVWFGNSQAQVTSATATQIATRVPSNLPSGAAPVTVIVSGVTSDPADFLVTAAQITTSVTLLDFGSVNTGDRKDLTLSVGNTGNSDLVLDSLTVDNALFVAVSLSPPITIGAGLSATVTMRFTPSAVGMVSGLLRISSNDPSRPQVTVNLNGTGARTATPGSCSFTFTPPSIAAPPAGASGTVAVVASASTCAWTASSNVPWLTAFSGGSGSGNGTVTYTVSANTGTASRSGALTIGGSAVPVAQAGTTVQTGTQDIVLQVENGVFNNSVGIPLPTGQTWFINRLTPARYPATLKSVAIYFGNRSDGLKVNQAITVLSGSNPTSSASIPAGSLTRTVAKVNAVGEFNSYPVASQTISSGDFLVGFLVNNASGVYPAEIDEASPSRRRSYGSIDGAQFVLLDDIPLFGGGNLGIRANVTVSAQ